MNLDTDFDGLNDSTDPIPKDYDITGNGRINHVDLVDENSLRNLSSMKKAQLMYYL